VLTKQVESLAQQTLFNLCAAEAPAAALHDVRLHVWEVPLWYRKAFPYELRRFLRNASLKLSSTPTKLTLLPSFERIAAIGMVDFEPTGVSFRKGIGLVGVCVAQNDPSKFLVLDTEDQEYRDALGSANELDWRSRGSEITRNLSLDDARRLANSYRQVIALVIRHLNSDEAIGCITVSTKSPSSRSLPLAQNDFIKDDLITLAESISVIIT
jgi:hypothetical protein